jgi:hypothetical protein
MNATEDYKKIQRFLHSVTHDEYLANKFARE